MLFVFVTRLSCYNLRFYIFCNIFCTGNPKGVLYSHRSTYIHCLMAMGTDIFGVSGTDCILPIVPMFHALCWGFPFKALILGFKVLLYGNTRDQSKMLSFMMQEVCYVLFEQRDVLEKVLVQPLPITCLCCIIYDISLIYET